MSESKTRMPVFFIGHGNPMNAIEETPYPWAVAFNAQASELIVAGDLDRLTDYPALGEAARLSIPTNEHFLPLLYALAQRGPEEKVALFADRIVLGSVSMQSVRVG